MNKATFGKLMVMIALFGATKSFAESTQLGRSHYTCNGSISLNEASNGDLSIQLHGINTDLCSKLEFYDYSSGRVIKSYDVNNSSYTLSKKMEKDLSQDCKVGFRFKSAYGSVRSDFDVTLGSWTCFLNQVFGSQDDSDDVISSTPEVSFQLSHANNCKLMKYGEYKKLVDSSFCDSASSREDVVTYAYSRKGNCKRMKNGTMVGQPVSQAYCTIASQL